MDKPRLAACGVDCSECGLKNAGHDLSAAAGCVDWFRERGWIAADGDARAVQAAVQNQQPYCDGCWGESGWCGCGRKDFRLCCNEQGIQHCGQCSTFPCPEYSEWVGWHEKHREAMEYLLSLG